KKYYYRVISTDASGNQSGTDAGTFDTTGCGAVPLWVLQPQPTPGSSPASSNPSSTDSVATEARQGGARVSPVPITSLSPGFKFTKDLKERKPAGDVVPLQIFLKEQGSEIYPEAIISGFFGLLTKKAVVRFQEKYADEILLPTGNSRGTGYVGQYTRRKINDLIQRGR
ncbi:MAG: hypothetical protein KBD66_03610, partial [Candidatus Doudnabacteria bacterium]|nr:hypothetical protein [Candidatus Doudnabacteria bacterium]